MEEKLLRGIITAGLIRIFIKVGAEAVDWFYMVIIFFLFLYADSLMITDAGNGRIPQSSIRYDAIAASAPGNRLDSRFQDPNEIPVLIRSLMRRASSEHLHAWIRRLLAGTDKESDFFDQLSKVCLFPLLIYPLTRFFTE